MPLTMRQRLLVLVVATTVVSGEDPSSSQNGTCNATGRLEPIAELCNETVFMGRWLGQNLGCADDFVIKTLKKAEGCPESGSTEIDNVYCETDIFGHHQIHPHWAHTTDTIYACWYFFEKYSKANWTVFNGFPNLDYATLGYKLHLFGIQERNGMPPPACTNDLHIHRKPGKGKSGWHHEEGGSNFVTMESAAAYRDRWLNILKKHSKVQHSDPKGRDSQHLSHRHETTMNSIQIGILNRHGSRQMMNPEVVYKAFIDHLPNAHITTLLDAKYLPSFLEQCQWVNQMDIIVAPHGAQLTNLVCAAPCTVLVEIYPPKYFIPGYFGPMANALGLETFVVYPGKDGYADTDPCCKDEQNCARKARVSKVEVPHGFEKLPPLLLKARKQCCAQQKC